MKTTRSNVYYIKVVSAEIKERVAALKKLLDTIAPFSGYAKDEFIPVKLTIGESSCVYNLNPDFAKLVVSEIKKKGASPFLFDTSVIYNGRRQNAVDHLTLAQSKGFGHTRVGAPFIVADGLFGQDGKEFVIEGKDIGKIKIPSFIGVVDSLLVLSHVTGHIVSRYAGAIKNVAMGMACRPTKQVQHSSLKPSVIEKKCVSCGCCIELCPVKAVSVPIVGNKAFIDQKLCIGCGECLCACKFDAIHINWHEDPQIFCKRMAQVAYFILSKFKNKFFLNFAFDITKECDCISTKDEEMVSADLGILASSDIVSLDKATIDLIGRQGGKTDFFSNKKDVYQFMLVHAQGLGMGSLDYNLIEIT